MAHLDLPDAANITLSRRPEANPVVTGHDLRHPADTVLSPILPFARGLDCLAPMGMAIGFGNVAGPPTAFPLDGLEARSLILARPTLQAWIADPEDLVAASEELFELVGTGKLTPGPMRARVLARSARSERLSASSMTGATEDFLVLTV